MKKLVLLIMAATFAIGNVNSQVKRTPSKRTTTSVAAKQKAEAEAKAKAEAMAKAEAKAKEIAFNNSFCHFGFATGKFVSMQSSNDGFVVYEVPNMSASELKSSVYTILSSMYKSPKDVITSLSDNMIQFEGYVEKLYASDGKYDCDISFNMIVQFKDGKVRYNAPNFKQIYINMVGKQWECDMNKGIPKLIGEGTPRKKVADYFNNIISTINSKLMKSNDW